LAVYLSMKEKTGAQVTAFGCVLRLLGCGRALKDLGLSELPEEMAELSRLLEKLKSFRFGSAFVMAGAQVNTGIGNTLLQYVNMFFHLDLIRFDRMLSAVQGEEDTLTDLLRVLGSLDAAAAVASFRASLPTWTEGEITENGDASNAWMRAEGLVHPLLAKPVPNDVSANGGNLLTGSNASGKSTFLKSVALAAILGQGLATVPANAYRAPFFRVLTSMALSDNLQGGESYFIVEIRSLKRILDAANTSGAPVLGIVDEVLRGTNTIERIAASAEILETLVQPNVLAFAATHDIELSYILEDDFTNLHFEEQFDGSDVVFDYKLREGRATSRNAIRLLSAAGYDPEITHRAESMAADFEKTGRWARTTD
ncbi:MAG: MutS-related protein, partial [Lachnospiraceae bacterium]